MEKKELIKVEKRTFIILVFMALLASGFYIVYLSWMESFTNNKAVEIKLNPAKTTFNQTLSPVSQYSFARPAASSAAVGKSRTLTEYYSRRAYHGAPPTIPHDSTVGLNGENCLSCHLNGGYVAKWDRNTPVTPHPQLGACFQCHVDDSSGARAATMTRQKLVASTAAFPPPIPHLTDFRENCIACHGGAAPAEIKTSHPERINCVQCHVEQKTL